MKFSRDAHEKMMSVYNLLSQDGISLSSFEHINTILKGIHPDLDKKLEACQKALHVVEKVMEADFITLSAENLPEKDEKQKKRKKALLFFISSVKNLQGEIKRIDAEFSQGNGSSQNTMWHIGRIIKFAKGPFGLITIAALVVVGVTLLVQHKNTHSFATPKQSPLAVQVILYQNKQIPLSQLRVGQAHYPNCDSPHYHALTNEMVTALDGTVLYDPGNCGFGKLNDVQVVAVQR